MNLYTFKKNNSTRFQTAIMLGVGISSFSLYLCEISCFLKIISHIGHLYPHTGCHSMQPSRSHSSSKSHSFCVCSSPHPPTTYSPQGLSSYKITVLLIPYNSYWQLSPKCECLVSRLDYLLPKQSYIPSSQLLSQNKYL